MEHLDYFSDRERKDRTAEKDKLEAFSLRLERWMSKKMFAFDKDEDFRQKRLSKYGSRRAFEEFLTSSCRNKLHEERKKLHDAGALNSSSLHDVITHCQVQLRAVPQPTRSQRYAALCRLSYTYTKLGRTLDITAGTKGIYFIALLYYGL